ncbi:MAG: Crp/Fnr family transcriptional regulator [Acidobacteria bacterium]|nr:MAG: Crp/Fnr family transcriptional regulator [Acidobacteriota bacterium]
MGSVETMISKVAALQATELFKNVSPDVLRSLAERAELRKLPAGEFLFSAGEPCQGLFVVIDGWTRALRHGADGREQVIHEDGPGSTFPEAAVFDEGPYPSTVIATHDSTLLFLRKEDVKRFCLAHPEVALSALKILSRRLRRATGMVERFALLEVAQRVATYLVQQIPGEKALGGRVELELKHTNQDIADRVGTVREVVSRAFAGFQRKGWLEKEGRTVLIVNIEALKRYAAGEE